MINHWIISHYNHGKPLYIYGPVSRVPTPPPWDGGGMMPLWWCIYIHTYIPTYLHTYVHTYIHTITLPYLTLPYLTLHYLTLHSIHTYIQYHTIPYIHTYIHTYLHTYQHTNIPPPQATGGGGPEEPYHHHRPQGGGTRRTRRYCPPIPIGGGGRGVANAAPYIYILYIISWDNIPLFIHYNHDILIYPIIIHFIQWIYLMVSNTPIDKHEQYTKSRQVSHVYPTNPSMAVGLSCWSCTIFQKIHGFPNGFSSASPGRGAVGSWTCWQTLHWRGAHHLWQTQLPGGQVCRCQHETAHIKSITLWLFNIAMENGPFIDGLPIKNGDFPWLC